MKTMLEILWECLFFIIHDNIMKGLKPITIKVSPDFFKEKKEIK